MAFEQLMAEATAKREKKEDKKKDEKKHRSGMFGGHGSSGHSGSHEKMPSDEKTPIT